MNEFSHMNKKQRKLFGLFIFLLISVQSLLAQEADRSFLQPVSFKYPLTDSLNGAVLRKIVVDYNNIVYVLSDKGLLRINDRQLVKDLRYTPLAQKIPVDIAIQE